MKYNAQKIYAAWVAFLGTIGIVTALSNPLTGFAITAGITLVSLTVVMVDLKRVDERLPSIGERTMQDHMPSIRVAGLTLATFIPFLFPGAVIAIGVIFITLGILAYVEFIYDIDFGLDATLDNVALLLAAGGLIVFSGIIQPVLLVAPALMFYWYVFTLLPYKTQRELARRFN